MNKTNRTLTQNYNEYIAINIDEFIVQLFFPFIRSGCYYSTSGIGARGSFGTFRERKSMNQNSAYYMHFNSKLIIPQHNDLKREGYSLRCVAKVFCLIKHFCYFSLNKPHFIFANLAE